MLAYEDGVDWTRLPDSILLQIFTFLEYSDMPFVGRVCKSWLRVSLDEFLWRYFFYKDFQVDPSVPIMPGKTSWREEYQRLIEGTPVVETEEIHEHNHQVLHVSFSHKGDMFATSSKDGYIIVWGSSYPAEVKYYRDMKLHSWKYTQFSQFNSTDTLLLVSGVHFGSCSSTSGEIAVFNIERDFQLQCRVLNKPYDIFGTWYNDQYLLSGELHWLAHLVSTSVIWLNKAKQENSSEHQAIISRLYKFYNRNASSVRTILVANCLIPDTPKESSEAPERSENKPQRVPEVMERGNPPSHRELSVHQVSITEEQSHRPSNSQRPVYTSPITYTKDYRESETVIGHHIASSSSNPSVSLQPSNSTESLGDEDMEVERPKNIESEEDGMLEWAEDGEFSPPMSLAEDRDKFLIFTTGSKTYSPHQIGFKRIKKFSIPTILDIGPGLRERIQARELERELRNLGLFQEPNWLDYESVADKFDTIDHLIDLNGHIIGMGLSPDHRYLYVNSRPWQANCVIENPLNPPRIAEGIDLHVIDLTTLTQVGTMLRSHKAYTPNDECFFIFLDVSHLYVASGAEDRHGYVWERHYGVCLSRLPHKDVVNAVAFNPRDPEMLVTVSDDNKIKVWRSRRRARELGVKLDEVRMARELRISHPRPEQPPQPAEAPISPDKLYSNS
ncbi:F-box/WD repeat-containing protein 5-like isoform X1 [Penaeus chinensis]|uniref:F-box/WD repeat-containing protein 5-like isoform X1 n=1 Tax=Penaeus chinensis TaxID=139456 RepID=UPI001FB64472|nr:F-box/WD repeat-containing protein 5-like isoform X1 [Penaeus chinensis]XP_047474893.1 F-box/WD repeat-containing protein 5-like isoform X1 [Penaeus chinensis]XP_047474902.1 F-box/WD repeat-containing protein 5-like isoform X1 [Penaeus chinensis]XP_047474911.1 F-box/WD repeat-containing protein 5-like isoform X1 [Penaeus chinensis]